MSGVELVVSIVFVFGFPTLVCAYIWGWADKGTKQKRARADVGMKALQEQVDNMFREDKP